MSKNLSKFMNWLKNFSDYTFLIHKLPQKGNLPQVKKHCSRLVSVWDVEPSCMRDDLLKDAVSGVDM